MDGPTPVLQRRGVRCDACGAEVPRHMLSVRSDRRRWYFYGGALLSIVLLWWLLLSLGVPGEVMQYGTFFVNLPAVLLVFWGQRYPKLRVVSCPSCGVVSTQPFSRRKEKPDPRPHPENHS